MIHENHQFQFYIYFHKLTVKTIPSYIVLLLRLQLLCGILFFSIPNVNAQVPSYFPLEIDELNGSEIYDIIQTKDHNYLFATNKGVFLYNYTKCSNILPSEAKSQSVFNFVINENGVVYCYNLYNQIFSIQNGVMKVFYELSEEQQSSDLGLTISFDNFLIVQHRGFSVIDEEGKVRGTYLTKYNSFNVPFTFGNKSISHINESDSALVYDGSFKKVKLKGSTQKKVNLLFFQHKKQFFAFDVLEGNYYHFDTTNYSLNYLRDINTDNPIHAVRLYVTRHSIWMAGTSWGTYRQESPVLRNNTIKKTSVLFTDYFISKVYEDKEGNILLGTFDKGILVIPNQSGVDNVDRFEKLPLASISHTNNALYFGTESGNLVKWNGSFQTLSDNGNRSIIGIYPSPNGKLIVFDDSKIKVFMPGTNKFLTISKGSLKGVYFETDHSFYLATNYGVEHVKWDGANGFALKDVNQKEIRTYAIGGISSNKEVYVATSDGLKAFSSRSNKLQNVLVKGEKLYPNALLSTKDRLYVSSKQNSILVFKDRKVIGELKPTLRGKPFDLQKFIRKDDYFIANTNEGLIKFDQNGKFICKIDKSIGVVSNQIIDFDIYQDQLWITHSKGTQKIRLSEIKKELEIPKIRAFSVYTNGQVQNPKQKRSYKDYQRNFKFVFVTPTLRNQDNIVYYYKLEGSDTTWTEIPFDRNGIEYKALSPGKYIFRVKAANQNSFGEEISYSFRIDRPFYAKWWFFLLVFLLLFLLIAFIFKRRLEIQRRKSALLNELNASKLTAIQSQMNPHFIFNALNSIQDLVLKGDVENSYKYITKFSNLVRRTLNYSSKDLIEFDQEIKLIELYLSLEKLRFKNKLEYSIEFEGVEDILIPPMLVQPFIENSLLHGLLHKEGEKKLSLHFRMEDVLICEIIDNGVGRKKAREIKEAQEIKHDSFSGEAINRRLEILSEHFQHTLYYEYIDLEENGESIGTKVILRIPYQKLF